MPNIMTLDDAVKILEAAMIVNKGDNGVEIQADFGLDIEGLNTCKVWVFSPKTTFGAKVIDSFSLYEFDSFDKCVKRIMKYNKGGNKDA